MNGRYPKDKDLSFQELRDGPDLYNPLPDTSSSYDKGKGDKAYNLWVADTKMGYALSDAYDLFEKVNERLGDKDFFGCSKLKAEKEERKNKKIRMEHKCNGISQDIVISPGGSVTNPLREACDTILKAETRAVELASEAKLVCENKRLFNEKTRNILRWIAWSAYQVAKIG